jgi:putative ATP-dependent endonuclease of OLD family
MMNKNKNPYISNVKIRNFRNFLSVNVNLDHKQVIIGENNVGKTNFLRALQLILDKNFSDTDRQLGSEDFHDSLDTPLINGEEIEISLQVRGYEHNRKLVAQFSDAVISTTPPTIEFTYRYFPNKDESGNILNYIHEIYKGNNRERKFTSEDRSFINIHVVKALRDVERELKASKNSPLYRLVKEYEISEEHLEEISDALQEAAKGIFDLDEIIHIKDSLTDRFSVLSGLQTDSKITLRTFDIDTERLLYSLQVYMGMKERPVSELSSGLANILYISLILLLLTDKTIIPVVKNDLYQKLLEKDTDGILSKCYVTSPKGNYVLNGLVESEIMKQLYKFMDEYNYRYQSFTILAIEEPEAHLHPTLQRLIYREVLHSSDTSVIFTSHSSHIASVTPLKSIVHIRRIDKSSKVFSTVDLKIQPTEINDIERYIDTKRGELYFGKGVVLVEGITEEYIVPAAANLLSDPFDDYGVVVCNVDSTNFSPYVQILNALSIPWVILTDGDYYKIERVRDPETGKVKNKRTYHVLYTSGLGGYRGQDNILNIFKSLSIINEEDIPADASEKDELLKRHGAFIGTYTLEVDMMDETDSEGLDIIKSVYQDLQPGGKKMKENFEKKIEDKDFYGAVKKIEDNISKGRFAQRLSNKLTANLVPSNINEGIKHLIDKVKEAYE